MWKSDPWRLYHIGDFFTDLALDILGGEKTAGSSDSGYINNWDLDAQIEVRGCSNRNTLKIYSQQLDNEAEIIKLGFPFSNLWYMIFFYRNQWVDKNRSLSKETDTRKEMDAFLSKNIMAAFVIDARVLMAIRRINGLRVEQRTNEPVYTIRMNKRTLHNFVKNPKDALKHFGLRGFNVLNHKVIIKFRGCASNFNLVFILPKKQLSSILQLNLNFSLEGT